jgi:23S rRNA (uridine2552-2'-O)-methyltransferase
MARELHDFFFRLAKEEGYLSRAAYKLTEIDDRKRILRRGDLVLDCGSSPGSWLQVAAKRVGANGFVVGVDLKPPATSFREPNIKVIQGDFTAIDPAELTRGLPRSRFDVVLSDMAPGTTGDPFSDHHGSARLCEALLDRAPLLLRPGGNLVMKVFEGETYPDLLKRFTSLFEQGKGFKPKASRDESVEMYLVGQSYRPRMGAAADARDPSLPPRKPSSGWATSG